MYFVGVANDDDDRVCYLGGGFGSLQVAAVIVQHLCLILERGLNSLEWGDHVGGTGVARPAVACVGCIGQSTDYGDFFQTLKR
jgi:hypothetical protein